MKNITISSAVMSLMVPMLVGVAAFAMVPSLAHAQEFGDSYDGGCCDDSGGDYYSYPDTSYYSYPDTSYYSYPDTSYDSYGDSSYYSYPDTYDYGSDYSYPSYTDYGSQDYTDYGYTYPTYPTTYYPTYPTYPTYPIETQPSNSNTNVNVNSCTGGSCNTSSSVNAPTTIISYAQPSAPACTTCGCPGYAACYTTPTYNNPPVTYNNTRSPYVSLTAVPYTGLDLGPWGTALYWGFLVLWCLVAAYLIAVKRIHNKFVAWITGANDKRVVSHSTTSAPAAQPKAAAPKAEAPDQFAGIDPFIASQIKRAA